MLLIGCSKERCGSFEECDGQKCLGTLLKMVGEFGVDDGVELTTTFGWAEGDGINVL